MATYVLNKTNGSLLTSAPVSYKTIPASTKARFSIIDIENLGQVAAKVWTWIMPSGQTPNLTTIGVDLTYNAPSQRNINNAAANMIAQGYVLGPGQGVNLASSPLLALTAEQIWAMTNFARNGTANAAVLTTTEIVAAASANITYAATTITDTGAAYTASPNNADLVGRRIEVGNAYLIATSNTGTVITGTAWIDKQTGLVAATPTGGAGGSGYTILASLRDTRETALTIDAFTGHLMTSNAKTGTIVGNNAGIATYGTTFQILAGGWSGGGNPGNGNLWTIDSLVRLMLNWIEES